MNRAQIVQAAAEAAYGARVAMDRAQRREDPLLWDELAPAEQQRWRAWADSVLTGERSPDPEDLAETAHATVARTVAEALGIDVQTNAGPERILDATARRFHTTADQLRSGDRHAHIAQARHAAMYLCKRAGFSFPVIGRFFGQRDHTTVMSGVKKIGRLMGEDPVLREHLYALAAQLGVVLPERPVAPAPALMAPPPAPPTSGPVLVEIPDLFNDEVA